MSRTRSVSEACAVKAARPITKATAAGARLARPDHQAVSRSRRLLGAAAESVGILSFMFAVSPCLVLGLPVPAGSSSSAEARKQSG